MGSVERQIKKIKKSREDEEKRIIIIVRQLLKDLSNLKNSLIAIKSETLTSEIITERLGFIRNVIASAAAARDLPKDSKKLAKLAEICKTLDEGMTVFNQQFGRGEVKTKTDALAKLKWIIKKFNSDLEKL